MQAVWGPGPRSPCFHRMRPPGRAPPVGAKTPGACPECPREERTAQTNQVENPQDLTSLNFTQACGCFCLDLKGRGTTITSCSLKFQARWPQRTNAIRAKGNSARLGGAAICGHASAAAAGRWGSALGRPCWAVSSWQPRLLVRAQPAVHPDSPQARTLPGRPLSLQSLPVPPACRRAVSPAALRIPSPSLPTIHHHSPPFETL